MTIRANVLDGNRVYAIRVGVIDRGYAIRDVRIFVNVLRRGRIDGCGLVGVVCSGNR